MLLTQYLDPFLRTRYFLPFDFDESFTCFQSIVSVFHLHSPLQRVFLSRVRYISGGGMRTDEVCE